MKVTIICPVCRSKYLVDMKKIPDRGGRVTCKTCGSKIAIHREDFQQKGAPSSAPDPPLYRAATCPKCGFVFEVKTLSLTEKRPGEKYTVLLIEDDLFFTNFIRATLGEKYKLLNAQSAEEALTIINREPVDIILLDLTLKGDNGKDFLKKIEKKCPILIVTSHDEIDIYGSFWEELKDLGADDIIHKTINMEESLLAKMESLLASHTLK